MNELKGKKLLVIGGAFQHCKVVETSRKLGVITYVTDYLPTEKSPAKQMADYQLMFNITDIDEIVDFCKKEKIDGVISVCLDACQKPYQQICERLGLPCFGTKQQFEILTDKTLFKKCCIEHGVDVIPEYDEAYFLNDNDKDVEYPLLVKPCISRGSRGSAVCYNKNDVIKAIETAKKESANSKAIIEKYMGNKKDICVSYIVIDKEVYLTRVGDRRLGHIEDKMERVSMMGMAPSKYIEMYLKGSDKKVRQMLKSIGLENAPAFMQGFVDGDTVRFYDPGLRYPGAEYERMYERVHNESLIRPLIEFALLGKVKTKMHSLENGYMQRGKLTPYLLISVRPGKITEIIGAEQVKNHHCVVSMCEKYKVGDVVGEHYNVNQRFCEIDLVCEDIHELCKTIDWIYDTLIIKNENGENMVFSNVDTKELMEEHR